VAPDAFARSCSSCFLSAPGEVLEYQKFIITVQLPVVLFLIVASFQSARAFRKMRFYIIAFGWSANLFYLGAENIVLRDKPTPSLVFAADFFVLLSSYSFLVAGRLRFRLQNGVARIRLTRTLVAGTVLFLGAMLIDLVESGLVFQRMPAPQADMLGLAHALTHVGFHGYALYSMGTYLYQVHERVAVDDRLLSGSGILPMGTFGYAAIQPLYLISFVTESSVLMVVGFFLGLAAKTAISVGYFHLFVTVTKHAVQERARLDEARAVVGRINHEAMTPLLEIGLSIEELQRDAPHRGRIRENVETLDSALQRVRAIMEAARNVTFLIDALKAGDLEGGPDPENARELTVVNVNSLVQTGVMAVKTTRKGVSVTWRLQYSGGVCIRCVPYELVQVMINLLRNACDALPDGKGEISIVTSRVQRSARVPPHAAAKADEPERRDEVRVEVRDSGEGVGPAIREKIFEEGFSTRPGPDRGYGLHVVQRLVAENGGTIELKSPVFPERTHAPGSEFVLVFPRVACKQ
jgi:signal transduction histidine kinase